MSVVGEGKYKSKAEFVYPARSFVEVEVSEEGRMGSRSSLVQLSAEAVETLLNTLAILKQ